MHSLHAGHTHASTPLHARSCDDCQRSECTTCLHAGHTQALYSHAGRAGAARCTLHPIRAVHRRLRWALLRLPEHVPGPGKSPACEPENSFPSLPLLPRFPTWMHLCVISSAAHSLLVSDVHAALLLPFPHGPTCIETGMLIGAGFK